MTDGYASYEYLMSGWEACSHTDLKNCDVSCNVRFNLARSKYGNKNQDGNFVTHSVIYEI